MQCLEKYILAPHLLYRHIFILFFKKTYVFFVVVVVVACFCHTACEVLVSWPGIEPAPPAWEDKVFTTGLPGGSLFCVSFDPAETMKVKPDISWTHLCLGI